MKRLWYAIPVLVFLAVAGFLLRSLFSAPPDYVPSALLDKPAPRIAMPALDATTQGFGPAQLAAGHVTVMNVFASWCVPCRVEAPMLDKLARRQGFELYGLVQKDTPDKIHAFLDMYGNPFRRIALDADGRASMEWGVYGVPETYVVDGKGIVRFKYVGPLDDAALERQLLPAIRRAQSGS